MRIQDKFDTILKTNKLGIKSIYGLETFSKVGVGSVSKFLNEDKSPTLGTIKKIQEALSINTDWWDTGKGDIYLTKHADMPKAADNKEKSADEIYRDLVEGNTEYILIPRSVLQEKYRLVSVEKLEEDRENWKKDKAVIDRLLNMYEELAAEMKGQLKAQSPVIKEAQ